MYFSFFSQELTFFPHFLGWVAGPAYGVISILAFFPSLLSLSPIPECAVPRAALTLRSHLCSDTITAPTVSV